MHRFWLWVIMKEALRECATVSTVLETQVKNSLEPCWVRLKTHRQYSWFCICYTTSFSALCVRVCLSMWRKLVCECFKCWCISPMIKVQARLTSNQPDTAGKSSLKSRQRAPRRVNTPICNDYCLVSLPTQFVSVATATAGERVHQGLLSGSGGLITIRLCPDEERAKRQNNMSVNNRLTAQWWYYRLRDVWLSWDPSLPRGQGGNTSSSDTLYLSVLAYFGTVLRSNSQTTHDIHRSWQVSRDPDAGHRQARSHCRRRFIFSGSILYFLGRRICRNTQGNIRLT